MHKTILRRLTDTLYPFLRRIWIRFDKYMSWLQRRKRLNLIINLVFLAAVLGYVFFNYRVELVDLSALNLDIHYTNILFGVIILWFNFMLMLNASMLLIRSFGGPKAWLDNAIIYSYSEYSKYLPSPAWFYIARVYQYSKTGFNKKTAFLSTGLESVLHVTIGGIIYLLLNIEISKPLTWLFAFSLGPLFLIVWYPGLLKLKWINRETDPPGLSRRSMLAIIIFYSLTWLAAGPFVYLILTAVIGNVTFPLVEAYRYWILSNLIAFIGVYTLGGIGLLREYSLVLFLSRSLSPPMALLTTIVIRLVLTFGGLFSASLTLLGATLYRRFIAKNGAGDLSKETAQWEG